MFLIKVKRKPALNRIAPISAAVFRSPDLARKLLLMKIYRSALLRFADDGQAVYDSDALLAVAADASGRQRVVAAGSWCRRWPISTFSAKGWKSSTCQASCWLRALWTCTFTTRKPM